MLGANREELDRTIKNTSLNCAEKFLLENEGKFKDQKNAFAEYMRERIRNKGILQQEVFLKADISERYGYKLISQEKHTKRRDIIIRICYAASFNIEETQYALRPYGMPELNSEFKRDALIMIALNNCFESIINVNEFIRKNGEEPLRPSGIIE